MIQISFSSVARVVSSFACVLVFSNSYATNFPLPSPDESLLGKVDFTSAENGDTTTSIAQRYNVGLNAIIAANPGVAEATTFQSGASVEIPTQFLLPPLPRRGIIVNLPEMRMYYFPEDSNQVMTFPIGIGKIGKTIPIANTSIARKATNPTWTPPQDIRDFDEAQGIDLPDVVPAGPDNPLGPYGIYLGIPSFLIHSTIYPESIGRRASFGCIRMNEGDIKQFFPSVKRGMPVTIIDMPNKIAWNNNELYMEAHEPLIERSDALYAKQEGVIKSVENLLPRGQVTLVDWQLVSYLSEAPDGVPHQIGVRLK